MTDGEVLGRIDEHMARGNELMAGIKDQMAGIKDHLARGEHQMERMNGLHDDTRQFMRDVSRRNEIVLGEISRESRAGRDVLVSVADRLADLRDESRAQRAAIFALIDELREHGIGGPG
jgi:hypothetical protein